MNGSPNKLKAVLIASGIMVFFTVTPLISIINLVCCAGIVIGGFAGVYFYNKDLVNFNRLIEFKDGVMIGLLGGIISAVAYTGFVLIVQLFSEGNMFMQMSNDFEQLGFPLSPEFYEVMDYFNDEVNKYGFSPTLTIISLVLYLILFPLFGAIGGMLAVSIFRKKQQPTSV